MLESNFKEFEINLDKFWNGIPGEVKILIRTIVVELHNKIIARTPLGTGFARASWNVSINQPDTSVPVKQTVKRNKQKQTAISELRAKRTQSRLANFRPFDDTIWINNSAPYILELEAGHSPEAPQGMVLLTLAELEAKISAELV